MYTCLKLATNSKLELGLDFDWATPSNAKGLISTGGVPQLSDALELNEWINPSACSQVPETPADDDPITDLSVLKWRSI